MSFFAGTGISKLVNLYAEDISKESAGPATEYWPDIICKSVLIDLLNTANKNNVDIIHLPDREGQLYLKVHKNYLIKLIDSRP